MTDRGLRLSDFIGRLEELRVQAAHQGAAAGPPGLTSPSAVSFNLTEEEERHSAV